MKRQLILLALLAPLVAWAAPRTTPSVPVVSGQVQQNAVITDTSGSIFIEFVRGTYVVDPTEQYARAEANANYDLLKKLREGGAGDEAEPPEFDNDRSIGSGNESDGNVPEEETDMPDLIIEDEDNVNEDNLERIADAIEGQNNITSATRYWVADTEILPPEIIDEPAPNNRPYTRWETGFVLYNSSFRAAAFTDSSRSKTKGVKVLMMPPEDAQQLKLWQWTGEYWRRLGGRMERAEGSDEMVFTAYIDGTGTYGIYEERPEPGSFDEIELADDLGNVKPFTVPDGLTYEEAINYHKTEVERYELYNEVEGKTPDSEPEKPNEGDEEVPLIERGTEPESESKSGEETPELDGEIEPINNKEPAVTPLPEPAAPPSRIHDELAELLKQSPEVTEDIDDILESVNEPRPAKMVMPNPPVEATEERDAPAKTQIEPETIAANTIPTNGNAQLPQTGGADEAPRKSGWPLLLLTIFGIVLLMIWSIKDARKKQF